MSEAAPQAFYVRDGAAFQATESTRGPWDEGSQHAGPPSALLGKVLDEAGGLESAQLARITYEILRPVPIGRVEASAEITRPGRSVEMVEGALTHDGVEVMRARAWRIRTQELQLDREPEEPPALVGPEEARGTRFFPVPWDTGYHTAMDVRFVSGEFTQPGPAVAWLRMRGALIEGEEPTPLDRLLVAADTGNGVSGPLDYRRWIFINTDLTVNVRRLPEGEWVGLDAVSYADRNGVGMSDSRMHDAGGMVGRATQALLIAPRT